ncbi:hypothetical protein [Microbaculum marinum]|uniref:DUF4412 domain-containing protein n=1 Tax=Microbaculum marinum TaxID=1764581 RepID=A0AAW9RGI2_9HYPH
MTSRIGLIGLLTVLFTSSPALAEVPYPTVDFQGEWVLSDDNGNIAHAEMHYSADQKKMRIKMQQQGMEMSSVRDMTSGEMLMWSNQMPGMAMRLPTPAGDEFDAEPTDEVKTIGSETCTIWKMKEVEACLTEENIPVQTSGMGFGASLENIERITQDAGLFSVPEGVTIRDMPMTMPGAAGIGKGLPF